MSDLFRPEGFAGQVPNNASAPRGGDDRPIGQVVVYYWGLFKRYFWIVLLTCALATAAAYMWTTRQPKVYQTRSKIIFHQKQEDIFGKQIESVDLVNTGARWQFEQFWRTQKEILESKQFAQRVVEASGLLANTEVIPAVDAQGKPIGEDVRMKSAVGLVQRTINTSLQEDTRVAIVAARSHDPKLAQTLANAFSQSYIQYIQDLQSGGLDQMITWFDKYVAGKRKELNTAQQSLHEFKRDNGILSVSYENQQSLTSTNMETLNAQLAEIKRRLAAEESLIDQIRAMQKKKEDLRALAKIVPEVYASDLSAAIGRESALGEKLAQFRGRGYLQEHPEVRATSGELEVVREHIESEIERIVQGARNRAEVLIRERSRLQTELKKLRDEAFQLDALGVQYNQLRDNASNLKDLFGAVLKRSEELDINSMYEARNVEVLEEAEAPSSPVSPNMALNLAIGLALGLGLGGLCLVLIDVLDNTVKQKSDVSRYTDRPMIGSLPSVNASLIKEIASDTQGNPLDLITHLAPKSSFAEAVKSLRTNLLFMAPDNPPQLVLVTSPGPSEGKTTLCTNMAIAMAQSGMKTVIIDSDMRRPRLHKAFGMVNGLGLSSAITKAATLEEVVNPSDVPNLDVITCGPIPPNPSELLHTKAFKEFILELRGTYDRIIFDSPPMGIVSDALILSHSVDATLLLLKLGKTRREVLKRSMEQLVTVGSPFMGYIINSIDSGGGYGYTYYYAGYGYETEEEAISSPQNAA